MKGRLTTRRQRLLFGLLVALAVLTSLYAIVIAVIDGVDSALTPIILAVSFDMNCVLFLRSQSSPSSS
jgi:hypothetical protein